MVNPINSFPCRFARLKYPLVNNLKVIKSVHSEWDVGQTKFRGSLIVRGEIVIYRRPSLHGKHSNLTNTLSRKTNVQPNLFSNLEVFSSSWKRLFCTQQQSFLVTTFRHSTGCSNVLNIVRGYSDKQVQKCNVGCIRISCKGLQMNVINERRNF